MVGTLIRRPLPPVSDFIRTLLDDTSATEALTTLGILGSTYSPTHTLGANLSASTSYRAIYLRVGNRVIVSGLFDADPVAASTNTQLGVSLPIPTTFVSTYDLVGVVSGLTFIVTGGWCHADTANSRANFTFTPSTVSNHSNGFVFQYHVA